MKLEEITNVAWNKFRITTTDLSTEMVLVFVVVLYLDEKRYPYLPHIHIEVSLST